MEGRRVYPNENGKLLLSEGDYGFDGNQWWGRPPEQHAGSFSNHKIKEHDDGTITVSPSILFQEHNENGQLITVWHGFLKRGIWRRV